LVFEIQGGRKKVGTPIRLMAKLIGLRQLRANVTVRSSWSSPKFCPGESLFLGIASCRASKDRDEGLTST
jgi:hypothetical protein